VNSSRAVIKLSPAGKKYLKRDNRDTSMKKEMMYRELANYYDLLYVGGKKKDYIAEAQKVIEIATKLKRSRGNDLLEVACGTGKHLEQLKQVFTCVGTDINQGILNVARKNINGVLFKRADMMTMNLGRQFDVVTCLFSSIGYVKTRANLKKTIDRLGAHVKLGGVLMIEPWFWKGEFAAGKPHMLTHSEQDVKIARAHISRIKGNVSILDFNFLIAETGKGVRYFKDRHELGLFVKEDMLNLVRQAGFEVSFVENVLERGLCVGVKK